MICRSSNQYEMLKDSEQPLQLSMARRWDGRSGGHHELREHRDTCLQTLQ